MMKKFTRYCSAALCLGAALLLSTTCFAQATPFLAAGSSAAFNAMAIGGAIGATPAICTNTPNNSTLADATNVYIWSQTGKSGHTYFSGQDNRASGLDLQNAKGWIEWSGSADGTTLTGVCVYLAVDSIVGQRLFFATNSGGGPAGTIDFAGGCSSGFPIAGDNQVPLFPADTPLPAAICTFLNGKPFNAAPTDIRAEDASFGTLRACGSYNATGTFLGYTCTLPTPTEILSGVHGSTGKVQAVNYAISGTDPLSSTQIAHSKLGMDGTPWVSINGGGQAVLVLVNTSDTTTNGFGSTTFNNINRTDLARVFTGGATRTRDVIGGTGLAAKPLTALVREPLSGTFNTFEFQVTRTLEWNHTQEDLTNNSGGLIANGIGIAAPTGWANENGGTSGNPLDWKKTSTGGLKVRVIGTGEMVSTIDTNGLFDANGTNALTNQIGYAFFSFGNVKGAVGAAKYLLVDGVDPLFDGGSGPNQNPSGAGSGALPLCTGTGCPNGVTLTNIANGSYPIWNFLRVVTTGSLGGFIASNGVVTGCVSGATVCQMVQAMQSSFSVIPDLVPISKMDAFRSHSSFAGGVTFPPHNGYKHYTTGVANTPCGFAPVTGASIQYECGSDVGGARFLIQQELDYNTDAAAELLTYKQ
jgi:hypothetical protein